MSITLISWKTPLTNAIINGNGDLEKNAGADNCFTNASGIGDAGARSNETITAGDFEFGCTLGPVGGESGRSFIGLAHATPSPITDFTLWDYCVHISTEENTSGTPHPVNSLFVYQGSPPNVTYLDGVWTNSGQLLRFVCQNGQVRLYLDSLLVYTFGTAPVYSLFAVASLACLGKTVIDPYFSTVAQGTCDPGVDTGDACSGTWTKPTPAAFPTQLNGGPRLSYFDETTPDWGEHSVKFPDGQEQAETIQTVQVRTFRAEWEGLSEADATVVDAHYESTRGGLKFTLTQPYTSEVITGVRYKSFSRPTHQKVWAQSRSAELILYTS